jgi:uncharacterized protein YuzE
MEALGGMKIIYDQMVDALSIRLVEEPVECETIRLNDQVAVDIAPKEQIVTIEVLEVSKLVTDLRVVLENLAVAPRHE